MPTQQVANPSVTSMIIPYIVIFFIFWFLVIKPQKDKQKEHKNMLVDLKKNDDVVTVGGVHGTVVLVKETTVVLRVDDNVKIEFDKESITTRLKAKS